jgi:DNA-binding transcriptional LysR family regulator
MRSAPGGSLAAAARKSQARSFQRLPAPRRHGARLGVRLFERARDGYAPTPAGETAIATAARVLAEIELLEHRLAGEDLRPSGSIRITTTDTLIRFVAPLAARVPRGASGDRHRADRLEHVPDADAPRRRRCAAPLARSGRRAGRPQGRRHRLRRLRRQDNWPTRSQAGAQAWRRLDWIGFDESIAHIGAAQWVADHVPAERIVHRTNSIVAMEMAARAGLGLALLPRFQGDPGSRTRARERQHPACRDAAVAAHPPRLRRVARVRVFLDFMAERIPRTAPRCKERNEPAGQKNGFERSADGRGRPRSAVEERVLPAAGGLRRARRISRLQIIQDDLQFLIRQPACHACRPSTGSTPPTAAGSCPAGQPA